MPDSHQQRIGRRIAQLREEQGWSQRALAKVLGIDQSALSRLEAGRRRVTASELQRLSHAFNLSVDQLLAPSAEAGSASLAAPDLPATRDDERLFLRRALMASEEGVLSPDLAVELAQSLDAGMADDVDAHGAGPAKDRLGSVDRAAIAPSRSPREGDPPAYSMSQALQRPAPAPYTGKRDEQPGPVRGGQYLPPAVAAVVRDWFRLRDLALDRGLPLPWSQGRSAHGRPATSLAPASSMPLPTFTTPQLPPDEVLYDRLARFWRNELHVEPDGPLPDLVTLLEDGLGVQVIVARLAAAGAGPAAGGDAAAESGGAGGERRAGPSSSETPFCAAVVADGVPFLFVNGARPVLLQRFALAHAFAHLALGHGDLVVDERIEWTRANPREAAANDFAEEFLAPVRAVARWYERRGEQTPAVETLLELGNAFGVSVWAALYRSRAVERARSKTFSALRAELQRHEWELLPRQAFLGGLRDTLSALTPGEVHDAGAFGPPAVLRVPAVMRRWALEALGAGRLSLEEAASSLRLDPAALSAELERLGLA